MNCCMTVLEKENKTNGISGHAIVLILQLLKPFTNITYVSEVIVNTCTYKWFILSTIFYTQNIENQGQTVLLLNPL